MNFLNPDLDNYCVSHTANQPEYLEELSRETWQKIINPRMLSGRLQGRFLSSIAHMIKPKRVLEIGTYTGFSALCFAEGLPKDGEIITLDINDELEPIVSKYIEKAGFQQQIKPQYGNALDIIPTLNPNFDLVFIDADKSNYLNYYNLLIDQLPSGAHILADNVLWSGKVIEEVQEKDVDTKTLIEFNQFVQNDPRVENVLLPIRDGLMLIRKV